jgi:hypothetical protein
MLWTILVISKLRAVFHVLPRVRCILNTFYKIPYVEISFSQLWMVKSDTMSNTAYSISSLVDETDCSCKALEHAVDRHSKSPRLHI